MTRFATQMQRTGVPNLIYQFGESITYYPVGGGSRSITAMIEREVEILTEADGVPAQATVMRVENSSSTGISSTEIDTGGDEVAYALRVGESVERKSIVRVMSTSNGFVRFIVQ